VAIVDPLWIGHHPMYFAQFSASFMRNGARVIGICPSPGEARRDVSGIVEGSLDSIISHHLLVPGGRSMFNGRFEGDPVRTFQRWKRAGEAITKAEINTGWHVDLVFFPYLDSYLRFLPIPMIPSITIGKPWSGLYLRNHHHGEDESLRKNLRMLAKGDVLMSSALCREIGVLDERFNLQLGSVTRKPVVSYPDFTHTKLPDKPSELSFRIHDLAKGRKIIGLIGLEPRKGVICMMKSALTAASQDLPYFFVFAGKFAMDLYSPEERKFILGLVERISDGTLTNVFFELDSERIASEADFNSLFSVFDVAWAAYENFQGSSGTLGKAAAFEIPVVASTGECIAQRVERYRTGLAIPPGDTAMALSAIPHLLQRTDWENRPLEPRYEAYRNDHSIQRLDAILLHLLQHAG
jgi:hypothetical protein